MATTPSVSHSAVVGSSASALGQTSSLPIAELMARTQELFGNPASVELVTDPENPRAPFVVVTVGFDGSAKAAVKARLDWHERISSMPGVPEAIRLSIVPAAHGS